MTKINTSSTDPSLITNMAISSLVSNQADLQQMESSIPTLILAIQLSLTL